MINLSTFIRESLERQVSPTVTMADLLSQLAVATGIDQDRIGHIVNGVITDLSSEQIASIARALQVPAHRLQGIYDNDRAYQSFVGVFAGKEKRVVDTDELAKVIAATVQAKLDEALRPLLVRMSEIEDRAMQRARFVAGQPASQEKSVSTGARIPAFDLLTDVMHRKAVYTQPVAEAPIEPSRTHVTPPAFEMLRRQLGALTI